jgi:hypothetical protein
MNSKKSITLVVCFILLASLGNMVTFSGKGVLFQRAEVKAHATPLTGYVYWDQNMNQILEGTEPPAFYDADFDGSFDANEGAYMFFDNSYDSQSQAVNGAYSISAPIGNHWVTVRLPGWQVQTKNISIGDTMHPNDPLNFGLVPFDSIIGRVTKPDGTGVVGVHIFAYPFGKSPVDPNDPLNDGRNQASPNNPDGWRAEAITDLFGNYVIKGLPPGSYDVLAYRREYVQQWKYNVVVDAHPMTVGGIKFNWHQTKGVNYVNFNYRYASITGFVLAGGGPLDGATVEIPGLGLSTMTDSNGNYRIDNIPMGWYYVTAKKSGYSIGVQFVSIGDFECSVRQIQNFNLDVLGQDPCCAMAIQGKVTDGVQALENARVEIPGLRNQFPNDNYTLYTDKSGYYIFTNYNDRSKNPSYTSHIIPAGASNKYYVLVHHDYLNPFEPLNESDDYHKVKSQLVVVLPDKVTDADFILEENPGFVKGRIVNTDGIPVEGATISVPNSPYTTVTDSFGAYVLKLPAEIYSEGCIFPYPGEILCGVGESVPEGVTDPQSEYAHGMYKVHFFVQIQKAGYKDEWLNVVPTPGGTYPIADEREEPPDICENCWRDGVLTYETGILKGSVYVYDTKGTSSTTDDTLIKDILVTVAGRDTTINTWISNLYEFMELPVGSYHIAVSGLGPGALYTVAYNVPVLPDQTTLKRIPDTGDVRVDVANPPGGVIAGIVYHNYVKYDGSGNTIFDTPTDLTGIGEFQSFEPGEGVAGVKVTPTILTTAPNNITDTYGFYVMKSLPTTSTSTTIVAEKSGWTTAANPTVQIGTGIYSDWPGPPGHSGARGQINSSTFPMIRLVGSLSGRITNVDGRDITDATAIIFIPQNADGTVNTTDETDTNGFYIFQAVEYGTYLIEVCGGGECGIGYEVTFSLGSNGQGEPVPVAGNATRDLVMPKKVARVEGFVEDTVGNILVDAEVKISGKYTAITDCEGYYTILNVPTGDHTAIARKLGYRIRMYNNIYSQVNLVEGEIFIANFTDGNGLIRLDIPMDTGAVEGFVDLELTDGFCNVEVDLNGYGQNPDTYSDSEGWWIILEVNPGSSFYVHYRLEGYEYLDVGPFSVSIGNITNVGTSHLKRSTCTVTGTITDSFTGLPIVGATVRISDMHRTTLETTYGRTLADYATTTNASGVYTFNNVPWSDAQTGDPDKTYGWTIYAIKDTYFIGVHNIILVKNDCSVMPNGDFTMKSMWGAISGAITWDGCTATSATVTATALVAGYDSPSTIVSQAATASYKIYPVKPGAYTVAAAAGACSVTPTSYTGATAIPVNAGQNTTGVDFVLGTGPPGILPGPPTLSSPSNGATGQCPLTGMVFSWTAPSTGTTPFTYTLQVTLYTDTTYATPVINLTGLTATSYTASSYTLLASTQYRWRVKALNSEGEGPWSSEFSFTTGTCTGTPPGQPTLSSPSNGLTGVCPLTGLLFSWIAPATGTTPFTYTLQVTLYTDTTYATPVINLSGLSATSYTASSYTLLASTQYRWRVSATNSAGTGPWSSEFSFTTGTCTTTETAPSLTVTPSSACPNSIYLSWSAATPPTGKTIAGYNIYRNTTAGVNYNGTPYAQVGNQLYYTDNGVSTSQAIYYYYVVRARYTDATLGLPSNEASTYTTQDCTGGGGHEPRDPEHPYPMVRVGGSTPVASIEHSFLVTAGSSMLVEKGKGEQSVNVKNTGAVTQFFEVKAQAPEGFKITFSADNFSLGPTFSKEVDLSVVPPPNVSEGVYNIKVIVNSDSGDSKTVKLSMEIYFPKLKLSDFSSVPSVPSAKEETKISAKVTNSGSKDEKADVYLLADGKQVGRRSVLVTKGASVMVFFNWMASEGAHKFVFQMGTEKLSGELSVTNPLRIQAESLYSKAMEFFNAGNWQGALETFREAKVLLDQLGESKDIDAYIAKAQKSLEADALFAQAQEYLKSGNHAKASEYFASAEKAYSEAGNTEGMEAAREGMTKSQTTKSESKNASYAKVAVLFVIAAIGAASSVAFYLKSRKPKRKEIGIPKEIKL